MEKNKGKQIQKITGSLISKTQTTATKQKVDAKYWLRWRVSCQARKERHKRSERATVVFEFSGVGN